MFGQRVRGDWSNPTRNIDKHINYQRYFTQIRFFIILFILAHILDISNSLQLVLLTTFGKMPYISIFSTRRLVESKRQGRNNDKKKPKRF